MIKRLAVFLILTSVLTGAVQASTDYNETFKLEIGEDIELGSYEMRYQESEDGQGVFQTGIVKENGGTLITDQFTGDEISDIVGNRRSLDSNLNYTIEEEYRGIKGRYLIVSASSTQDVFASANLESDNPQRVLVDQGGTVSFTLEIENTGVVNQTFELSDSSDDISSSFTYQGYNVSQIFIPAGETRTVNAELEVRENTSTGLKNINITAENRSKTSDSILLSVLEREQQEPGEPRIDASVNEQYKRANPGEDISIPVTVRNSGQVTLEDVEATVEGPDGWSTEVRPENLGTLEQYRSGRATVTVEIPEDVSPGDYFIDVSASSDQIGLEEPEQVRVNVSEQSGLRYVGVFIMVLSLAALLFVYRRFGRR